MTEPTPSPREMVKRLVAFDTTSAKSNLALIDFVRDYLAAHGVDSKLIPNDDGTKANLFASIGPEEDGGVVLSGHTDVVPVEGQDWDSDPWTVREDEGRYYGRGTADMKSFIAVALALVPAFRAATLKRPVHFAFSYDEELGCLGAPRMIARFGDDLPRPRLAIIGEPTMMRPVTGHKSSNTFRTTVTGLEAHSSATHRGVNAIAFAAEIVSYIGRLASEAQAPGRRDAEFEPPYTTFNVGRIEGGTAFNIIPRHCRIDWEFRAVPGTDPAAVRAQFDAFVERSVLPSMRRVFPEATVATETRNAVPALVPQEDSPAERLAMALTGANRPGTVAFASEAGQFQGAGVPAILCGPGDIAQAHKPNEFIEVAQIDACEAFLRRLITKLEAG